MSKRSSDPRLAELRALFAAHTDTEHAAFHKNYHKSTKKFYGLRAAKLTELVKHVFPARQKLQKEDVFSLADELWVSEWFEEQVVAIMLVERIVKDLTPADLPHLKMFADGSDGWATLDHF